MNIFTFIHKFINKHKEKLDLYYYESKYAVSASSLRKITSNISFKNTYVNYYITPHDEVNPYYSYRGNDIQLLSELKEYHYVPDYPVGEHICLLNIMKKFDSEYITLCFSRISEIVKSNSDNPNSKNKLQLRSVLDSVLFDYYPEDNIVIIRTSNKREIYLRNIGGRPRSIKNNNIIEYIENNKDEMIIDLTKADDEILMSMLSFEGSGNSEFFDIVMDLMEE